MNIRTALINCRSVLHLSAKSVVCPCPAERFAYRFNAAFTSQKICRLQGGFCFLHSFASQLNSRKLELNSAEGGIAPDVETEVNLVGPTELDETPSEIEDEMDELSAQQQSDAAELDPNMGYNDVEKRKGKSRPVHDWETCLRYMNSKVYKETYGDFPVWKPYRRNVGTVNIWYLMPATIGNCLDENGKFRKNWPCPICRDEYLVFDYRIPALILQFLESSGQVMPNKQCYLCKRQYDNLQVELLKAYDYGTMTCSLPFRNYEYRLYDEQWRHPPEKVPDFLRPLAPSVKKEPMLHAVHNPDRRRLIYPKTRRRQWHLPSQFKW